MGQIVVAAVVVRTESGCFAGTSSGIRETETSLAEQTVGPDWLLVVVVGTVVVAVVVD